MNTFPAKIFIYAIFNDQSFNNSLTNDIVSFEQLGPKCQRSFLCDKMVNKLLRVSSPLMMSVEWVAKTI